MTLLVALSLMMSLVSGMIAAPSANAADTGPETCGPAAVDFYEFTQFDVNGVQRGTGFWSCDYPTTATTYAECMWPNCVGYRYAYSPTGNVIGLVEVRPTPQCGAASYGEWQNDWLPRAQRVFNVVHFYTEAELASFRDNPCTYPLVARDGNPLPVSIFSPVVTLVALGAAGV